MPEELITNHELSEEILEYIRVTLDIAAEAQNNSEESVE